MKHAGADAEHCQHTHDRIPDKHGSERPERYGVQLTTQRQGNNQTDKHNPAQGSSKPVGDIGSFKPTHRIMILENDWENPALQNSNRVAEHHKGRAQISYSMR